MGLIYSIFSNSVYTTNFINIYYRNRDRFKIDDHLFIIESLNNDSIGKTLDQLDSNCDKNKIIFVPNSYAIYRLIKNISSNDNIILHNLNKPRLMFYLYFNKHIIDRCTWSIWSGDVYFFKENNIKSNLIEYLRSKFIPLIPRITSIMKGDYEVVQQVYGGGAKYLYSFYPIPINFDLVDNILANLKARIDNIVMVGNSADPANNHLEIFSFLERYKNQNIKILCPLSYGGRKDYVKNVIGAGKEKFGGKFIPLTRLINPERYLKILGNIDVMILNHKRQQGLGSVISALDLQKKVYIRSDTSPFSYFTEKSVTLYDTLKLENDDFYSLFDFNKDIGKINSNVMRNEFSEEHCVQLWRKVLEQ